MWMDIETAPKDRRIIGYGKVAFENEAGAATVRWNRAYSRWECDPTEATEYDPEACALSHWMPLPEPPVIDTKANADPYGTEARNRLLRGLHGSTT